jgi:hypothetical protein
MENHDRFDMPDRAFSEAQASHGADNPTMRMGMYVPTRHEVASLPIEELSVVLDLWMWESPSELIPSYAQIRDVRSVLETRSDADTPQTRALIAECDKYLASESRM